MRLFFVKWTGLLLVIEPAIGYGLTYLPGANFDYPVAYRAFMAFVVVLLAALSRIADLKGYQHIGILLIAPMAILLLLYMQSIFLIYNYEHFRLDLFFLSIQVVSIALIFVFAALYKRHRHGN